MWTRDIYYEFPQALYLLLFLIPFTYLSWSLARYRHDRLQAYTSSSLLPSLLHPRSPIFTRIKTLAWILAWIGACLALTNPKGYLRYSSPSTAAQQEIITSTESQANRGQMHDVIFLVDTSASMAVLDAHQGQSRLEDAKEIVESIISQLQGENVALYAFTSELLSLVPPTLDYIFARLVLNQMGINEGDVEGTNMTKVLETLKRKVFNQPSSKFYTVILISDGGDNTVEELQGQTKEQAIQNIVSLLPNPVEYHLRLFTIGVGSKAGGTIPNVTFEGQSVQSKLEEDLLQALASQGRGIYYAANSFSTWNLAQNIVEHINQAFAQENTAMKRFERQVVPAYQEDIIYNLYYQIPLGFAIACLLLIVILPEAKRL